MHISRRRQDFIEAGYKPSLADVCTLAYIDGMSQSAQVCDNFLSQKINHADTISKVRMFRSDLHKSGHALMEVMKKEKAKNPPEEAVEWR